MADHNARVFAVDAATLVEETGLRVPFQYDCQVWQEAHPYHTAVPSRNLRCELQAVQIARQQSNIVVDLPVIDEEYSEMVAVYQAALRARGTFVMVELGARWGTWGSRAVTYARRFNPAVTGHDLLYVEPESQAADGLRRVHAINGISNYTLLETTADARAILEWASTRPRIDVFDVDIQGGEMTLLPAISSMLTSKVRRLIVGTHSQAIHESLMGYITGTLEWTVLSETPFSNSTKCVVDHFRTKFSPADLLRKSCYSESPYGKVVQWDGEIIADNPAFAKEAASNACHVKRTL